MEEDFGAAILIGMVVCAFLCVLAAQRFAYEQGDFDDDILKYIVAWIVLGMLLSVDWAQKAHAQKNWSTLSSGFAIGYFIALAVVDILFIFFGFLPGFLPGFLFATKD